LSLTSLSRVRSTNKYSEKYGSRYFRSELPFLSWRVNALLYFTLPGEARVSSRVNSGEAKGEH
jgi:hypothetical protein